MMLKVKTIPNLLYFKRLIIFYLKYLKGMGESNCTWQRKLNLNKDLLIATQAIYKGF